jgi:hypothetical protein
MSDFNSRFPRSAPADTTMAVDAGLRAFMIGVYNKLGLGLLVAGAIAWVVGNVEPVAQLMYRLTPDGRLAGMTPLGWIVAFAPLVILLGSGFAMRNPTAKGTGMLYWAIVALMGASMGVLFLIYTGASIASTFFVTAAAFGALSLWGYTTKKNLTGMGTFLLMGLIGLIIASIVNIFMQSSMLYFIINAAGVLIFAGLIAYDTQRLKLTYYEAGGDANMVGVLSNWGALSLFINFVNLFRFLLAFMGVRRD